MNKLKISFTVLLVFFLCAFEGKNNYRQIAEIKGNFKFFTTDKLGNVFVITQKNDIQKFDKKGNKITEANFKVLGDAHFLDVSNPLEIYVFYKDQNKIVYFDNMLNYRGETDLYKLFGINNLQTVCRSYDNGFWFFDPDNFKLKKSGKSGELTTESNNLSAIIGPDFYPELMVEDGKFVYLKASETDLYVFDILGTYIKIIHLDPFNSFQIKDKGILYCSDKDLVYYQPETFETESLIKDGFPLFGKAFKNIRLENDLLYIQDNTSVKILSL